MSLDLKNILSRITVGKICPSMTINAIDATLKPFGVPHPGIQIIMQVYDAFAQDKEPFGLYQWYPVPAGLLEGDDEKAVASWIFDRVRDVLVHELEEFFTFDGENLRTAQHPLPES